MKIIGILGGIGSGKSTVANEFEKLGCVVINADKMAHEYLDNPDITEKLKDFFGQNSVNSDGKANRKVIAEKVFSDGEKLSTLNNLLHPPVMKQVEILLEIYRKEDKVSAVILDIPLLLEVGWEKKCDFLIFIDCLREKRLARIKKCGIMPESQLDLRESFQVSPGEKAKKAHYILDNNSDFSYLCRQVKEIFSDLVKSGG